jgi:hypothetical protein
MKNIITALLFLFCGNMLIAQDAVDCKMYRTGFFEYGGKHLNVVLYRDTSHQIEYDTETGEWVTIKMSWINDCKYSFTYLKTNMDRLKPYIGHSMDVEILNGNSEGYVYHSVYKQGPEKYDGKIIFLVTDLKDSVKKKIVKKLNKTKT